MKQGGASRNVCVEGQKELQVQSWHVLRVFHLNHISPLHLVIPISLSYCNACIFGVCSYL
jgi:hypothetical protein